MKDYSYVFNAHPSYIDELYQQFVNDPNSVEDGWKSFFAGFEFQAENGASENGASENGSLNSSIEAFKKEINVMAIIKAFRNRGHLLSDTNPIRQRRNRMPNLDLTDFQLSEADRHQPFRAAVEVGLPQNATLDQIINKLRTVYCGKIGFEYHHIENREKRRWLRDKIENHNPESFGLSIDKKRRILEKLNGAVSFEKFLHTKYVGQKRFSLEGGESTIAAIDSIINKGVDLGVKEVVIGMAHRGRLNVLANIMGKTYDQIFAEFEGTSLPDLSFGDGDVKYHLGFSSQTQTMAGRPVDLKLVPNPSHLEAVNPVVQGFSRAKADILYNSNYDEILPILIHGDAAVVGQGVSYETVQMSQLEGYKVGGSIHFVINNQIGFTTDFDDARSSTYSTAAASLVQAPVFHVNGDDPEAVVFAAELAIEYRQKFNTDVFIDMVCYRRHGHNEGDDPKFTQPQMYSFIKKHPDPREIYSEKLIQRGDVDKELSEKMTKEFWKFLQERLDEVKQKPLKYTYQEPEQAWRKLKKLTTEEDFNESPKTGINKKMAQKILDHLLTYPDSFNPLSKVQRLLKGAQKAIDADKLDWALGELMAYGSILLEGKDVRMSGQDCKRGTFSHRHAIFNDAETFEEYNRLSGMTDNQGEYRIFNSLLSEFAVMGFEFGYSMASPESLVIWEAQFGDFANGAQVMIDQFIAASESKWHRQSGLVLLLPHGYEGQGPEHSSARLERFLQLCGDYNMTVANITNPANFFHALRRQLERPFRKPLVVMSPKSLLRHPKAVSSINDFTTKHKFQEVIDDPEVGPRSGKKIKKLLLCSGKVYFDLLAYKEEHKRDDVAIVRLEQLYPFPYGQINDIIKKYSDAEIRWVQEEPANMGSWQFIHSIMCPAHSVSYVGRKVSASPATGFKKVHEKQQADLVEEAFA